jgi:hypothetical protein
MFFVGITIVFILFMAFVSMAVFFSKPSDVSTGLVFNKPKVNINMDIFDSEQFKDLQPIPEMELQFSYKGIQDKENIEGFVTAVSVEEARKILESTGLTIQKLEEVKIGRENPFEPYFQSISNSSPIINNTPVVPKTTPTSKK